MGASVRGGQPTQPWSARILLHPVMENTGIQLWVQAPDGLPVPGIELEVIDVVGQLIRRLLDDQAPRR